MTAIFGYRHASGDVLLAADARIGWISGGRTSYTDTLDKLGTYSNGLAIAFSTGNVGQVASMLSRLHGAMKRQSRYSPPESKLYRIRKSLSKYVKRHQQELTERTDLLVAIGQGAAGRACRLIQFTFRRIVRDGKEETTVREQELPHGVLAVCGSIQDEPGFDVLRRRLESALGQLRPEIGIETYSALLDAIYQAAQKETGRPWATAGELVYTVYTSDAGLIRPRTSTVDVVLADSTTVHVWMDFDHELGQYVQHVQRDDATPETIALLPLSKWRDRRQARLS